MNGGGWPLILTVAVGGAAAIAAIPTPQNNLLAKPAPAPVVQPAPPPRSSPDASRIVLTADDRGHFHALVTFSGPRVQREWRCMIDSGASWLTIQRDQTAEL